MKDKYRKTVYACFAGYIVQAIVNNFVPLLFLTFEKSYHIPLSQITMLITFNFGIQLLIDLLSAKFVRPDRLPDFHCSGTCIFGSRTDLSGDPAGSFAQRICGIIYFRSALCRRRRTDRSADQPHCRKLPKRQQRKGNEPSPLFLLLGSCGSGSAFHDFLPDIWN